MLPGKNLRHILAIILLPGSGNYHFQVQVQDDTRVRYM